MTYLLLIVFYVVIVVLAYWASTYLFAHDDGSCQKLKCSDKNYNVSNTNRDNEIMRKDANKKEVCDVNELHLFSHLSTEEEEQNVINEFKFRSITKINNNFNNTEQSKWKNKYNANVNSNNHDDALQYISHNCLVDKIAKLENIPDHIRQKLILLEQTCTPLPVCGNDVRVLHTPSAFYEEMKEQIRKASRSIVMTALYIGDGPLSSTFVKCLEDKIVQECNRTNRSHSHTPHNKSYAPFTITLLLDYNRMQCGQNLNTIKNLLKLADDLNCTDTYGEKSFNTCQSKDCSITCTNADKMEELELSQTEVTEQVEKERNVRVNVYLFQSPNKWNKLFARFSRAKEALGVQHTKLFIFDNERTILTGANLSDDYFASRMDRYIVFERNTFVAEWFNQLAHALIDISHPIVINNNYNKDGNIHVTKLKRITEVENTNGLHASQEEQAKTETQEALPPHKFTGAKLHIKSNLWILPNMSGFDPSDNVEDYIVAARERIMQFVQSVRMQFKETALTHFASTQGNSSANAIVVAINNHNNNNNNNNIYGSINLFDTLLFPTIQMGRLGIWHDTRVVQSLLACTTIDDHLYLTSPYLNLYGDYAMTLLKSYSPCKLDCITASVESNGWNGQKGLAGYIPFFYLQLERAFYFLAKSFHALDRIQVREFAVAGLSFHAKGIWFTSQVTNDNVDSDYCHPDKQQAAEKRQHEGKCHSDTNGNATLEQITKLESKEDEDDNVKQFEVKEVQVTNATDVEEDKVVSSPVEIINPLSAEEQRRILPPYLVAYGSTNYGYRSVFKDIESEAFLFTFNSELQRAQRNDLLYLLQESLPVHENRFRGHAKGRFQPVISLLAQLGQDFL